MDPPTKSDLAVAASLKSGKSKEPSALAIASETVWERVQRLGRNQEPFERPAPVEPTQPANNVDLSLFGADVQCLLGARQHVADAGFNRRVQYASAYRRTKTLKWSAEDTARFYEAVRHFGSDLLMVRSMLPEFTDKQIYDKFKMEEKRNPDKLNRALNSRTEIPLEKFERRYGKIDRSRHYDPSKDPVLLHRKNQRSNQLALRTQVENEQECAPMEPPEEINIAQDDPDDEPEVQGCNIMQLFM
ncbi:Transcription factor TFIIIB component B'' [Babesia sp. Xinjiang]|uniref:Transcription factor TFIIIB component B'' n=1 Tax=Babesia sp. Xinjiang TaxID=462227 RepID=UPI000A217B89|nr:Transcription factor TFIIIB component B'' [Babesia sp. Xinjiang]ORM41284.1 Transcription factor TFIIIB component B'' [Babesia sp. Xinjiang]